MAGVVHQYYEPPGAPMVVPTRGAEVADAWVQHRERLRGWLAARPAAAWDGPTRCSAWTVSDLVEHLVSGSQFLGYTLHQSKKGDPTRLLAGFDPQKTPGAAAAQFAGLSPADLLDALDTVDTQVAGEMAELDESGWRRPAEAPPGTVPAHLSVNHFLFDSWVHERDLLLPAGEQAPTREDEVSAVLSYVLALAGCARMSSDDAVRSATAFDVVTTDVDVRLHVERSGTTTTVTTGGAGGPSLTGTADDIIDFATGRGSGLGLDGDPDARVFLGNLAVVMG